MTHIPLHHSPRLAWQPLQRQSHRATNHEGSVTNVLTLARYLTNDKRGQACVFVCVGWGGQNEIIHSNVLVKPSLRNGMQILVCEAQGVYFCLNPPASRRSEHLPMRLSCGQTAVRRERMYHQGTSERARVCGRARSSVLLEREMALCRDANSPVLISLTKTMTKNIR